MKKIFISVFVILAFSLLTLVGCSKDASNPFETITAGTVVTKVITSPYWNNAPYNVKVYEPPGYNASDINTKYQVIYLLHGFGGSENTWTTGFKINNILDEMIANGTIEPAIVVMPNSKNALGGGFYTNSNFGAAESWIIDNVTTPTAASVVGYIEQVSQYGNKIDNTRRYLMGHSMGGYGTWRLMIKYADAFAGMVSHSAGPVDMITLLDSTNTNGTTTFDLRFRFADEQKWLNLPNNTPPSAANATLAGNPYRSYVDFARVGADLFQQSKYTIHLVLFGLASSFSSIVADIATGGFDTQTWIATGKATTPVDSTRMYQYVIQVLGTPTPTTALGVELPMSLVGGSDGAGGASRSTRRINTVFNTKWIPNDIWTSIDAPSGTNIGVSTANIDKLKTKKIYMDCGTRDDLIPADDVVGFGLIKQNNNLDAKLTEKGIGHTYETYDGAHSDQVYWRSQVALKFLLGK